MVEEMKRFYELLLAWGFSSTDAKIMALRHFTQIDEQETRKILETSSSPAHKPA